MMDRPVTRTRAERAAALEAWADTVDPANLREADTDVPRRIAQLAQQRADLDASSAARKAAVAVASSSRLPRWATTS
jgi:hypothetical protein